MNTLLMKAAGFTAADAALMTGVDWLAENPVDPMENVLIAATYHSIVMLPAELKIRQNVDKQFVDIAATAVKVAYIAGVKMLVNLSEGRKLGLPSALSAAAATSITRSVAVILENEAGI